MVSNDSRHFVDMMVVVREGSPKPQILQLLAGQVGKTSISPNPSLQIRFSGRKRGRVKKKGEGAGEVLCRPVVLVHSVYL
jgi:hypothetical protein